DIAAERFLADEDGPRVWLSITGYGQEDARVAFGDDAAVGGGLVVEDAAGPCFCADAVADPLTGLFAADACLAALADGGRVRLDGESDVTAVLRQADRTLPPGEWLRAVGWAGHEHDLDRDVLDAVVPDRPVRVQHRSGALWVLNSAALRRVGLDQRSWRLFG